MTVEGIYRKFKCRKYPLDPSPHAEGNEDRCGLMDLTAVMFSIWYADCRSPKVSALASLTSITAEDENEVPKSEVVTQYTWYVKEVVMDWVQNIGEFQAMGLISTHLQIVFTLCSIYQSIQAMVGGPHQAIFLRKKTSISSFLLGSLDLLKRGTSRKEIISRFVYLFQNIDSKSPNGLDPMY